MRLESCPGNCSLPSNLFHLQQNRLPCIIFNTYADDINVYKINERVVCFVPGYKSLPSFGISWPPEWKITKGSRNESNSSIAFNFVKSFSPINVLENKKELRLWYDCISMRLIKDLMNTEAVEWGNLNYRRQCIFG